MGILAMSHIVNAFGLRHVVSYLNYFFALAVHALIKFPENQQIKKYTGKIFEFYIKEKKNVTIYKFPEIQFLLLQSLQADKRIREVVEVVSAELYRSNEHIAKELKEHVLSMKKGNEDIRILSVKYILELLETKGKK